jgi:hypothetical protein
VSRPFSMTAPAASGISRLPSRTEIPSGRRPRLLLRPMDRGRKCCAGIPRPLCA